MANDSRSAKDGLNWTRLDLEAYNIECHYEDPLTFFGVPALPEPQVDPELLTAPAAAQATNDLTVQVLHLLSMAKLRWGGDSVVSDFAAVLFQALGYARRDRVVRTRQDLVLFVCGEYKDARADISIVDMARNKVLLVVREDEHGLMGGADPHAQLIAAAIAAHGSNTRDMAGIRTSTDPAVIPGIVMTGTSPVFYKVPVTGDLRKHVAQGTYPPYPTRVTFCPPPVPRPGYRDREGMEPLENRVPILSCYEAFKAIIGI